MKVDTIAALATPPGRGGIAVVRISGPFVLSLMETLLKKTLMPRYAAFCTFFDETGQAIDEGLAIFFPTPHSFTGEDVLELHGHGGPAVIDSLLKRILSLGARLARPGEFSERAFLNGKIDLVQAEAIADLIDAASAQAARNAMRSLQGEFSEKIHDLVEKIVQLRMYVEAAIDFAEEEIDFLGEDKVRKNLVEIITQLKIIQTLAAQGSLLREGITIVIAGRPNVGKSSLLNQLSGKPIAIVTDIPGTTRDILHEHIMMDGLPLHIIDTAGLRDTTDVIEQEGIRRAHAEIKRADVILFLLEAGIESQEAIEDILPAEKNIPIVVVRNKIDLRGELPSFNEQAGKAIISLSAKEGTGIDLLKKHIQSLIGFKANTEGLFSARRRHLDALERAGQFLEKAQQSLDKRAGELVAEELRQVQRALGEITGEFGSEDLLGRIFASFCIGK